MLSFSLRRRSAPGSMNGRDGSLSPSRGKVSPFPTLNSKRSIASLFGKSGESQSPSKANGITAVEKDHYPVYDPFNTGHNPQTRNATPSSRSRSSSRLSRKSSRSLSRSRSSSASDGKNILDWVAVKMKAATEYFHRDTSDHQNQDSGLLPARRVGESPKASPRKVRFQSGTYGPRESTSSPIAIPKRAAPSLPPIHLPNAPFMDDLGRTDNDSIPTARPPDTPVLKATLKNDYFFSPMPITPLPAQQEDGCTPVRREEATSNPSCSKENPFTDAAVIIASQQHVPEPSDDETRREFWDPRANFSTTDNLAAVPVTSSEDSCARILKASSDEDAEVPFLEAVKFADSLQQDLPRNATHEEIRHRFRARSIESTVARGNSPPSDSSTSQTPSESFEVSFGLVQNADLTPATRARMHNSLLSKETDDSEMSAVRKEMESLSLTDPAKPPSPKARARAQPQSAKSEVPEPSAKGLMVAAPDLKATVLATSPSRARRPFRFSNQSDQSPQSESIDNTSFSWRARAALTPINTSCNAAEKTPSPISIPLPLSIGPKKIADTTSPFLASCVDQYGWSPFQESHFPPALVAATAGYLGIENIHMVLSEQGGFAKLWEQLALPDRHTPSDDTRALTSEEIDYMIEKAGDICGQSMRTSHQTSERFHPTMATICSPYQSSSKNFFSPLRGHHTDYSGEVSTIDEPLDDSQSEHALESRHKSESSAVQSCSDNSCTMCRIRESYEESSNGRCAWSSSEYGSESDKENATPATPSKTTAAEDKTPKQADYTIRKVTRLPIRAKPAPGTLRGNRASDMSMRSSVLDSAEDEDEQFTKGII